MASRTEDQEQAEVIKWANRKPWGQFLLHIANETLGGKERVLRNAALGVRKGVPDLLLPIPRNGLHGLWIEMKRLDGGTVSRNQRAWIDALNTMGYRAVVCRGADQAIAEITEYMEDDTDAHTTGGVAGDGDQEQA